MNWKRSWNVVMNREVALDVENDFAADVLRDHQLTCHVL